jgi:hypothetical protein
MQELTTDGLKLFTDGDGRYWIAFGPLALVSLEAIKEGRGPITQNLIEDWAKHQSPKAAQDGPK